MDGQQQVCFTELGPEVVEGACTQVPALRITICDHALQGCRDEEHKAPQTFG
jgi:hypothetical protein